MLKELITWAYYLLMFAGLVIGVNSDGDKLQTFMDNNALYVFLFIVSYFVWQIWKDKIIKD